MSILLAAALVTFAPPPGAINPAVTQSNIHETICVKGWTKTIRPPVAYTNRLKMQQLAGRGDPKKYELDHFIPLELGGHPTDPRNLWPEPWTGPANAHQKDQLENRLHLLVCNRVNPLPLATAQHAIATDWQAAYLRYVGAGK